ncbi:toxin-antitoxin system antidote component [Thermosynechococcus sp. NK55a]|jgi:hypothetical protein|uniref:hypothetical protein n=1 Tax=Thermosynechococcus sp. NK55a TaxID=1394889 RepID=UPI0003D873E0|nr:hypothetical protein [Thermosynechococcus sp. NK55a]AHB89088.1 toxin-antitoxin system antidote component [Thermosynechococcus sp. NK55a]
MNDTNKIRPSPSRGRPGFSIKIEGPRVGEARLSANDLATIILRTQQALKRIGQVLYGESSVGQGRKKKEIEELCELFVVGWKPGSAVAEVELAEPPAQMSFFGYIGEESLKAFLNGMMRIKDEPIETLQMVPAGFDPGVLQTCDSLGHVLDHGVDTITFRPIHVETVPPVTFDRPLREKVRGLLGKPLDQRQVEKVGRLEVLDGHRGVQGRLWEPDGTRWLCIFKPEHVELLPDLWLRTVRVVGEAVVEPNRERVLNVASVVTVEEEFQESALGGEVELAPFWTSLPLEKLAELQGVQPADDLDQISALWPVDDDPDQMLAHILEERSARRGIARGEHDR